MSMCEHVEAKSSQVVEGKGNNEKIERVED